MVLAKSLHTVTVVTRVALHLTDMDPTMLSVMAVDAALEILGYPEETLDDPHGLRTQAIKQVVAKRSPFIDRRIDGYNPEFLGAKPARVGEDY